MKRLYSTVLENEPSSLGGAAKRKATPDALRAAETSLGVALPKTFKRFAEQVGAACWPVNIYGVEALARYSADSGRPAYLIAFASDDVGNDWCFDTRRMQHGEYAIVFWDHEEPPATSELEVQGPATPFDAWLGDLVDGKVVEEESDELTERRRRIESALEGHRETNTWPWAPSEADIATVQRSIGLALPKDYVWFTTTLGSTPWPLRVVDALELAQLTKEMRLRFPTTRASLVAFGRQDDGSFVAFQSSGRPVAVGGTPIDDRSFIDLLERRIEERTGADAR